MTDNDNDAPLLLDVSRLVWRRWSGTRATGIDRICHAWMGHFGARSQAVIIHKYGQAILPMHTSQALFRLLAMPEQSESDTGSFRAALVRLALSRMGQLLDRLNGKGRVWLNPGHTGLDRPALAGWCTRQELRPIYLIHDLIPITHPQFCREGEDERHRERMRTALDTAYGFVTNSAQTLESLRNFADAEQRVMPPARVAWPGTPGFSTIAAEPDPDPTFVIIGTIEGRKNHAFLLNLWRQMIAAGSEPIPRLVIVGRRGWQADGVFQLLDSGEFGDRVVEAGPLNDQASAKLLSRARALLFPSFAEGYGMPLAEALACGVPVIASDLPVFREIGQGVPELLPIDMEAWQAAILDYARQHSPRRSDQIERLGTFQGPNWKEHFLQVEALISMLKS